MNWKSRLRPAYKTARTFQSGFLPSGKPMLTIYGNCQADALTTMLRSSPDVAARYNVVRLPGAHEIRRRELPALNAILARTSVLVTQNIRDGYRGMPVGTGDIRSRLKPSARVLTFPSMFYRGLHPYLVYVHASGELGTHAPLTEGYHDLRFIAAAAGGLNATQAGAWLADFEGSPQWIKARAAADLAELRRREKNLDISVSDAISGDASFWTNNHPSNAVLNSASAQIHAALDVNERPWQGRELLSSTLVPVGADVRQALGFAPSNEEMIWTVGGRKATEMEILAAHLAFYRDRPEVLASALSEHGQTLRAIGLPV